VTVSGKVISGNVGAMLDRCKSLKRCSSMEARDSSATSRTARASSAKLLRESPACTLSTAARAAVVSRVCGVSACSCASIAITCIRSENRRDASTDNASRLASFIRVPARMLNESSITRRRSLSPCVRAAGRVMKGFANASASSTRSTIRSDSRSRYRSRRCLIELWVRGSKNMSELNGRGVVR